MKFRKKPVEIEARQFTTNNDDSRNMNELVAWMNDSGHPDSYPRLTDAAAVARHDHTCIYINTVEGEMRASVGDWIIRGVKGEFYPCKPDIFEATYDVVAEASA
jgi:hypothetical protein